MRLSICLIAALLACSSLAHADDVAAAKEHYSRGKRLYDLQRYDDAAHEFEQSYEAKGDPAILYNIAQAYRLGGNPSKAIGAYRAFLRNVPSSPFRSEALHRIAELEQQLNEKKPAQESPAPQNLPTTPSPTGSTSAHAPAGGTPATTTSPATITPPTSAAPPPTSAAPPPTSAAPPPTSAAPPPATTEQPSAAPAISPVTSAPANRRQTKIIAGAVVAGAGLALVAGGIACAVLAQSNFDQINTAAPGYVFDPSTQDAMNLDRVLAGVFIGAGAAAVVAGTAVLIVGVHERHASRFSLAPIASPRSAGALATIHF